MKIGILGAGQLGRMLALAAHPLHIECECYDPQTNSPASQVTKCHTNQYSDSAALKRFAHEVDLITFEFENISAQYLEAISTDCKIYPSIEALKTSQDRLEEKKFFRSLGISTADYFAVNSLPELEEAAHQLGFPLILKTRRLGYDGKGQTVVRTSNELEVAFQTLGAHQLIAESFVRFDRELSILGVRSISGELAFYPLTQNHHESGILNLSKAPAANTSPSLQAQAESLCTKAMQRLNYVGILTIELFQLGDKLIVNEMAPRVHNSGHWTIDGSHCSQFENHIRAVAGLSLGETAARGYSAMINLIGTTPSLECMAGHKAAHIHLYGKEPRKGRKLGHVNFCQPSAQSLSDALAEFIAGCHLQVAL